MDVYAIRFDDPANNPIAKISTLGTILNIIIPLMTIGAGLIFLTMLIYGAFTYMTSGGNPEGIKKAQGTLVSAGVGIFIVISAYLIVKLIGVFFNITIPI